MDQHFSHWQRAHSLISSLHAHVISPLVPGWLLWLYLAAVLAGVWCSTPALIPPERTGTSQLPVVGTTASAQSMIYRGNISGFHKWLVIYNVLSSSNNHPLSMTGDLAAYKGAFPAKSWSAGVLKEHIEPLKLRLLQLYSIITGRL